MINLSYNCRDVVLQKYARQTQIWMAICATIFAVSSAIVQGIDMMRFAAIAYAFMAGYFVLKLRAQQVLSPNRN